MQEEKYNQGWFKKRALSFLKKISEHVWDYSDSLLIYVSSGVEVYESLQDTDTHYFKMVTKPEREYLMAIAPHIAKALPENFDFIDLGPGTEHKEQFLFDELKKLNKQFTYVPVDISDHYLDLAEKHASEQNILVQKIKSSFEELPEVLGVPTKPRFVSLGLTFSNYNPQEILKLLRDIAGTGGYVFINSQMRDRINMNGLLKVYQEDAVNAFNAKLELLRLDTSKDISDRIADDGIRVWCKVLHINSQIESIGVKEGDMLLVFQSLRYTKASLEEELQKFGCDYRVFDSESSFIGTLIK